MFGLPVSGVELQNPWNFLCAESYKGVFFMLMSLLESTYRWELVAREDNQPYD